MEGTKNEMGYSLIEGSVAKSMIRFSIPLIGAFLLQSLYSMVDMLIVSFFAGTYSVSAVNIVGQVMHVVLGVATGFLSASTVAVAQYLGAGEEGKLNKAIETAFSFTLRLSLLFTAGLLIFTDPLLKLLQTPQECYKEAWIYYVIYSAGTVFVFFYNAISAVLRGTGDSKSPLIFVAIATTINIVLDLIFVGTLGWEAGGAAFATIIAQAVSVFISVLHLKRIRFPYKFRVKNFFKMDKEQLALIFRIGSPAALQETLLNASLVVMIAVANTLGVYASAAVGFGAKINVIFILPVVALNVALSTMVGQNIGAGKMDRAVEATKLNLFYSAVYSMVVCIIMWVFSKELLMIFTNDPQTLAIGANYFKGHCWDYFLLMPLGYCFGGLFMGTGRSSYIAIANGAGALISRIPLSIFLAHKMGLGVLGIGIAYPVSTLVTDVFYFALFLKGDWKKSTIVNRE